MSQSLTLECDTITVRGITSRVDIVWSSGIIELKRINNVNISLAVNDSELYKVTYTIPLLSTTDDGRGIECEVAIITSPSVVVAKNNITLDVIGKCCVTLLLDLAK